MLCIGRLGSGIPNRAFTFLSEEPFPSKQPACLDILLEYPYPHLECLLKKSKGGLNYCKARWIC
jgi:hypothetical protein